MSQPEPPAMGSIEQEGLLNTEKLFSPFYRKTMRFLIDFACWMFFIGLLFGLISREVQRAEVPLATTPQGNVRFL